jgi:F-type H+-transporting ATPase subunit b
LPNALEDLIVEMLQDAEFWVGVAFVIFLAVLIWAGVPKMAAEALDKRAQKIRDQLAEAERLRHEAEHLLASIKKDREAAEKTAAQIIEDAEAQAKRIQVEARSKLQEQVKRRAELAKRKIAQAEAQATAEVKSAAAELAAEAAETVLRSRLKGKRSDALVDRALEELPSKLS